MEQYLLKAAWSAICLGGREQSRRHQCCVGYWIMPLGDRHHCLQDPYAAFPFSCGSGQAHLRRGAHRGCEHGRLPLPSSSGVSNSSSPRACGSRLQGRSWLETKLCLISSRQCPH